MGRKPRIEYYGAIYHIIQGGNDKKPIFKLNKYKKYLLEILSEAKEDYDFRIFAYVIMDNHYHFLIQTLNISISRIMHMINTKYAKFYNHSIGDTGPVFEDRYISILVQDESYLLDLTKYIHNDPVVANICNSMEEYNWSSDLFYRVNIESIVDINQILNMLSFNRLNAIEKYAEFMKKKSLDFETMKSIYEETDIIGTDEFRKFIEGEKKEVFKLDEILRKTCSTQEEFDMIKKGSRIRRLTKYKKRYVKLSRKAGYTYREIGRNIGITGAAARNIIK